MCELGERVRPMIVCAVTLLPEPDSPTIASTSPGFELEGDPVDRLHAAVFGGEADPQAVDREQRAAAGARRDGCGLRGGAHAAEVPEPDARVEVGVGDVDQDVEEDDEEGAEERHRHDRGEVLLFQRFRGEQADAFDVEERLGDDRAAADQHAEVEPEQGDHRDQRVAQHVLGHHPALLSPLARAVRT